MPPSDLAWSAGLCDAAASEGTGDGRSVATRAIGRSPSGDGTALWSWPILYVKNVELRVQ